MAHLAIHDTLNAIVPVYKQYAYNGTNEDAHSLISASQAVHDVMAELFPNHNDLAKF